MMGHINNLILRMVKEDHGLDGLKELSAVSGLKRKSYQTEVVYPEAEFKALYNATKKIYGLKDEAMQKAIATSFLAYYPDLVSGVYEYSKDAREFMERVPTIHKQWPSAASQGKFKEKLWVIKSDKRSLTYRYESPNKMCYFLKYMALGILAHYKQKGSVRLKNCGTKKSACYELVVTFVSSHPPR